MPLSQQNFTATLSQPDRFTAVLERGTPIPGPPGQPREIRDEGVAMPVRDIIDMTGAGVTVTDDAAGERTVVTIPGQTPWTQNIDAALYDLDSVGVVRFGPYTGVPGPDAGIGNEGGTLHILTDNGGSVNIESFGNGRVMLSTDGTRRLVVHQNGKVGIGPAMNPAYTLDVQGDCNVSGVYRFPDGTTQATAAPVASVFGRIGAVIAAIGDYTVAQITGAVAATRRIIAGAGLTGGGDLSGDVTLSVDKAAVQSPWVADVDAAGKNLHNADTLTGKIFQLYRSDNPADQKRWVFQTNATDTLFGFTLDDAWSNQGIWLQVKRSGYMPTSVAFPSGNVGIGTSDPQYKLDVTGDINCTGVYRKAGVEWNPQTPWLQPVSAAGLALTNAPLFQSVADMVFGAGSGTPERMRILAATGNVRISAGMEVNMGQSYLGNLTYDGSNWRYLSTGSAFAINCVSGAASFFTAPNGTPGAVATLTSRTSWDTDGWTRFSAANVSVSTAGDTALEVKTTGGIQTAYLRLVTQQGAGNNEWDIVAAGAGLAGPVLRFAHGSPFAGPVLELGDSAIKMWLGGSLKTLSVDGSGFVKAA